MANGLPQTYNAITGKWEDFSSAPIPPPAGSTPPGTVVNSVTAPPTNTEMPIPATNSSTPPTPTASVAGTVSSVAGAPVQVPTPGAEAAPSTLATGASVPQVLTGLGPAAAQYGSQGTSNGGAQSTQIASAANAMFAASSGAVPNTNPQLASQLVPTVDPQQQYFDTYSGMNPIVQQLYTMTQQILSPQNAQQSFTQEYATLTAQAGIPGLQTQLMNIQNVMNGTEDDVRSEVTAAGGFATESQIQGIVGTRNKVLVKQANALSNLLSTQQQYVSQVMQFSQADQAQVNTEVNTKTGLLESMASLQQQMDTNATSNYQKTLTALGGDYKAFASSVPVNQQPYVERLMGLAPGTLSDPQELQILTNASYKQLQLQIAAQRANVYAYNAGYPTASSGSGTPTNTAPISAFAQPDPTQSSTYTVKSGDGLRAIANQFGITSDTGLQAFAKLNGIKDINQIQAGQQLTIPVPVKVTATGQTGYINPSDYNPSTMTQIGGAPVTPPKTAIDSAYNSMKAQVAAASATPVGGSPLNKGRLTRNANSALKNYISTATYQTVSNAVPYLSRIQSAMKDPGSISDTSLADSIIKIETGGGQVTDSQISTYFAGQSFSDRFAVVGDKIVAKGGVLSPQQRSDLSNLAESTFGYYQQQYEGLYVQAMGALKAQGIPLNYGTNLPDFTSLLAQSTATK